MIDLFNEFDAVTIYKNTLQQIAYMFVNGEIFADATGCNYPYELVVDDSNRFWEELNDNCNSELDVLIIKDVIGKCLDLCLCPSEIVIKFEDYVMNGALTNFEEFMSYGKLSIEEYLRRKWYEQLKIFEYFLNDLRKMRQFVECGWCDEIDFILYKPKNEDLPQRQAKGDLPQRPKELNAQSGFSKRLVNNEDTETIPKLRKLLARKRGKDAALIICAAIKKGVITRPTFSEVTNEFGNIGDKSGYNKYMQAKSFNDEEIEPIIKAFDSL